MLKSPPLENPLIHSYCHEPLPQNVERLRTNLRGFESRYELCRAAVAEHDRVVNFSCEPTGRYGRIAEAVGNSIIVAAADSNRVLAEIVERHGEIDLVKIDIEGLEKILIARMPEQVAQRIRRIAAERRFPHNPLVASHDMSYRRPITTFLRRT